MAPSVRRSAAARTWRARACWGRSRSKKRKARPRESAASKPWSVAGRKRLRSQERRHSGRHRRGYTTTGDLRSRICLTALLLAIPAVTFAMQETTWDFAGATMPGDWRVSGIDTAQKTDQGLLIGAQKENGSI